MAYESQISNVPSTPPKPKSHLEHLHTQNRPQLSSGRTTRPQPKIDLFKDSPCLVSKKIRHRTSTPSLRPPKPPTKQMRSFNHDGSFSAGLSSSFTVFNTSTDQLLSSAAVHPINSNNVSTTCNSTLLLRQEFEMLHKIGSGYFADVYKAKSLKDGNYYAIKRTSIPYTSNSDRSRKLQEAKNYQSLPPHRNCVKYYDAWEEDGYVYIQTELCKKSLNEILETSEEHRLPEQVVWGYLLDLLLAVKHLHDHDLLHMDIKPDNIFISFDGVAKLGDFGMMCSCSQVNPKSPNLDWSIDSGITPGYLESPSSIDSIDEGDSKYLASETMQGKFTKAADIFSLGITIFEVASGLDLPQRGEIYHKLRHNEIEDLYFNGLSADLVRIIKMMMEEDYTKRPTVDDLLHQLSRVVNINISY